MNLNNLTQKEMKKLPITIKANGLEIKEDIDVAEMINSIENKAIRVQTALEIFAAIDFSEIKLEDFQQAIIRPNALAVNKIFGFKTPELCIDFLDWCINSEIDYSLPEFSAKTIFDKFINSRS